MRMLLNKFSGKKKAQEIVQFAIIAPILIIFLILIVDFGTAITIKNAVSDATKASVIRAVSLNRLTGNTTASRIASIQTFVNDGINAYFSDHNIPKRGTFNVEVSPKGGVYTVKVVYLYNSYFASMFIPGLQTIPLQTSQAINNAMVQGNTYSALTTSGLSSFFPTPAGSLSNGQPSPGYNIRPETALLISWYNDYDISNSAANAYARLFSWFGEDLLPPNLRINIRSATIEVKSPYYLGDDGIRGHWLNTKVPYVWVVAALGYTQVIYTKYNGTADMAWIGVGQFLNACDPPSTYWWGSRACPLMFSGSPSYTGYRINPLQYKNDFYTGADDFSRLNQSFGYRWCDSDHLFGADTKHCLSDNLSNTQTVQELALKGMTREEWYLHPWSGFGTDYEYNLRGNYEELIDKKATAPNFESLYHYIAYTSAYNSYDSNYLINIWQPIVTDYQTGSTPVDYDKLDDSDKPFYKAFQWSFNLNCSGIMDTSGTLYDIPDVYLDNDGDGIPNAWDGDPQFFDRNGNSFLDGQEETNISLDTSADFYITSPGAFSSYQFPTSMSALAGVYNQYIIAPPMQYTAYTSLSSSSRNSSRSASSAAITGYPYGATTGSFIPQPYYSNFKIYNGKLYIPCDTDSDGMDDLCRLFPAPASADKLNFIYNAGWGTLGASSDISWLEANNFSAGNHVTRTAVGW